MTKENLADVLAAHLKWLRREGGGVRAYLTRENLSGANLNDANLADANLTGANLSEANLTDADLTGANLSEANLSGANLMRANLEDANLTNANLSGVDLTGAQGVPPIDTGSIHRRSQTAHIRAEVEAMLKEADREMSAEVLGGNIVKEALWKGEVTAFKKVLYLLDQSS
jgi:uncharacterized protein YjbI with pentapeptide repeats